MNASLSFIRALFVILSVFLMTSLSLLNPIGSSFISVSVGIFSGLGLGALLIAFDLFSKKFNLKALNLAILGSLIGFLFGKVLVYIFDSLLSVYGMENTNHILAMLKCALMLFGVYTGCIFTLRSADEIHISLPFIKLAPVTQKKRDIVVDLSALGDIRLLDLASSGLLDNKLVVPHFILKDLYEQSENGDETCKSKARRSLEIIKKLEELPSLGIRINNSDFPETKDINCKILKLVRLIEANILVSDASRIQIPMTDDFKTINLHTLAQSLKPTTKSGEAIKIKIQRLGKEPRQGVGYLDDGTMVVVNGGGDFVGESIDAQVLSVKHTTSGRIIFCNARYGDVVQYTEDYEEEIPSGNR